MNRSSNSANDDLLQELRARVWKTRGRTALLLQNAADEIERLHKLLQSRGEPAAKSAGSSQSNSTRVTGLTIKLWPAVAAVVVIVLVMIMGGPR